MAAGNARRMRAWEVAPEAGGTTREIPLDPGAGRSQVHHVEQVNDLAAWPDRPQVQQATIQIIPYVHALGPELSTLDLILHGVLITRIPSLLAARAGDGKRSGGSS